MTFKIIYKKASLQIINIDREIMNKIEISQIVKDQFNNKIKFYRHEVIL